MADRAVIVARGRTVSSEQLSARVTTTRPWRIRALDQAVLQRTLDARRRPFTITEGAADRQQITVSVTSDADAAALLAALVAEGVQVVSFQPAAGLLEQAYLTLTEESGDRR
jgi:ABC-2 type transport system ATP-binding protein